MITYIVAAFFSFVFLYIFHPLYTLKAIQYIYFELKKRNVSCIEINISRGMGLRNKIFCATELINNVEPIELEDQESEEDETEFGIVKKRTRHFVTSKLIFYIHPFK